MGPQRGPAGAHAALETDSPPAGVLRGAPAEDARLLPAADRERAGERGRARRLPARQVPPAAGARGPAGTLLLAHVPPAQVLRHARRPGGVTGRALPAQRWKSSRLQIREFLEGNVQMPNFNTAHGGVAVLQGECGFGGVGGGGGGGGGGPPGAGGAAPPRLRRQRGFEVYQ